MSKKNLIQLASPSAKTKKCALAFACFINLFQTKQVFAKGFWDNHNLGVSYGASDSFAQISYDADRRPGLPKDCDPSKDDASRITCTAYLAPDSADYPTPSLFIDEPFKRTGLFAFDFGPSFSTVTYKGGLASKPATPTNASKVGSSSLRGAPPSQPLDKAYVELYGLSSQLGVRLGLTPKYIPDFFVSFGVGLQTAIGRVKVFKEAYTRFILQPEAYVEGEIVLARAFTGALSIYYGIDQTLADRDLLRAVPDHPSGTDLTNFNLNLNTAAAGARLLFPF